MNNVKTWVCWGCSWFLTTHLYPWWCGWVWARREETSWACWTRTGCCSESLGVKQSLSRAESAPRSPTAEGKIAFYYLLYCYRGTVTYLAVVSLTTVNRDILAQLSFSKLKVLCVPHHLLQSEERQSNIIFTSEWALPSALAMFCSPVWRASKLAWINWVSIWTQCREK